MIRSMTGFGAGRGASGGEEIAVEIRSVNHKFCEVKVRLPRELAALEPVLLVRIVKDRLARGGIDAGAAARRGGRLDGAARRRGAGRGLRPGLRRGAGPARSPRPHPACADIVAAEGVIRLDERDTDLDAARAATDEGPRPWRSRRWWPCGSGRARRWPPTSRRRLATVESLVARVEVLAPLAVEHHRTRLAERVKELTQGLPLDPGRLAQEVALLADRSDVAEEITRLRSHVAQARRSSAGREPAGRKLDFLVQEMHREVNTIGSKSQHAELSGLVVSLKAEVERMREQVQNVE